MKSRRVVFYSHDTLGLGHIRRTQKLANRIADPERSILVLCSSPKASSFESAPGIAYLNLPGFTKLRSGEYLPRNLPLPMAEFVDLRAQIILAAIKNFRPDVLVIDKEPLGVKKELLPTLRYLREAMPDCKIVCGFRDILDEPPAVAREWEKRNTIPSLEAYFDHMLVYGEKKFYDFAAEYKLPENLAEKLLYTGYIVPPMEEEKEFSLPHSGEAPLVTFTLGGGEDGGEILSVVLDSLEKEKFPSFRSFVLTGPFAPPALLQRARQLAERRPDILVADFTDNPLGLFRRSALIVSMAGYNATTELMALGRPTLLIPRVVPRKEQFIRADIFRRHGFCELLHPSELTPGSLREAIDLSLARAKGAPKDFPHAGLDAFANLFAHGGPLG